MAFYRSAQDQVQSDLYDKTRRQDGYQGVYDAGSANDAFKTQEMQWYPLNPIQSPAMQDLSAQVDQMKTELAEAHTYGARSAYEAADVKKACEAEKTALLAENQALLAQLQDKDAAFGVMAQERSTLDAELQQLRAYTEVMRTRGAQLEKSAAQATELEKQHYDALHSLSYCLTSVDGINALPHQATLYQAVDFACQSVRRLSAALSTSQGKFSDLIAKHSSHVLEHYDEALQLAQQRKFLDFMKQHAGIDELATVQAQWVVLIQRAEQLYRQVAEHTNTIQGLKQENVLLHGYVDDSTAKVVELEQQSSASKEIIAQMKKHAHEQQYKMFAIQAERDAVNFEVQTVKSDSNELNQQLSLAQLRISANDEAIKQFLLENAGLAVDLEESKREIASLKTQLQSHEKQYERVKSQADKLLAQKYAFLEEISHCGTENLYTSDSDLKDVGEALSRYVYTLAKLAEEAGFKSARCLALLDEQKKITSEFGLQNYYQKQELYEFYSLLGEKYPFCSFARLLEKLYLLQYSESHAEQRKEQLETEVLAGYAEIYRLQLAVKQTTTEMKALNEYLCANGDEKAYLTCQIKDFEAYTRNLLYEMQQMKELIEEQRITVQEAHKVRESYENELSAARTAIEKLDVQCLEQQRLAQVSAESLKIREQEVLSLSQYLTACRQHEINLRNEKTDFIVKVNEKFGLASIFGANDQLNDIATVVTDVLRDRPDDLPNLYRNYAYQVRVGQELTLELQRARGEALALRELYEAVLQILGMQSGRGDLSLAIYRLKLLSAEKDELERQLLLAKEKQQEYLLTTYRNDDNLQQLQYRYASADQYLTSLRAELEDYTAENADKVQRLDVNNRTLMQQYEELYEKREALDEMQRLQANNLQELEFLRSKRQTYDAALELYAQRLEGTQRAYEQVEKLKNEAVEQLTLAKQHTKRLYEEKTQFIIDANATFQLACAFDVGDPLSDVAQAVSLEMQQKPALMTNLQRNYADYQVANRDLTERFQKASIELQLLRDFRASIAKTVMPVAELDALDGILQRVGDLVRVEAYFSIEYRAAATLKLEMEQLRYRFKSSEDRCTELAASLASNELAVAETKKRLSEAVYDKNSDQTLLQSYHEKTLSLTYETAALRASFQKYALELAESEQGKRAGLEAELYEGKRQIAQLLQERRQFIDGICACIGLDPVVNGNITLSRVAYEVSTICAVKEMSAESTWPQSKTDQQRGNQSRAAQPKCDFCLSPAPFPRAERLRSDLYALRNAAKLAESALKSDNIPATLGAIAAMLSYYYRATQLYKGKPSPDSGMPELSSFKRQLFEYQKIILAQLQYMGIFYCGGDTVYLIYFLMAQISAGKRYFSPVPEVFAELRRLDSQNKELASLISVLEIKLRQRRDG